jgi:CHAT domain-containing protein
MADAGFQPLPATREEAQIVAELWKRSVKAGWPGGLSRGFLRTGAEDRGVVVLTGKDATEGAFKRLAPGRRVLHVATHGFFLDEKSRWATGPATTRSIGEFARLGNGDRPPILHPHPLRLSGFVLAGANRIDELGPDDEDGILTSEEIAAMNLRGAEWAVLSACDTGVGAVQDVEGVVGLRRAFQVAGVRTLIMSLWAVDDRATRRWMEELYRNRLEDGASTLDSVHQASLSVLESGRSGGDWEHPFFWAAFVAAGDWR